MEKARPVFTTLSSRGTRWPRNHPLVSSISRAWHRFSRSNRINTDKPGDSCHGSRRFWSTFNGQLRKTQTEGHLRDAIPFVRGWIQRGLGQNLMDLPESLAEGCLAVTQFLLDCTDWVDWCSRWNILWFGYFDEGRFNMENFVILMRLSLCSGIRWRLPWLLDWGFYAGLKGIYVI